jgi:hypothetical protein
MMVNAREGDITFLGKAPHGETVIAVSRKESSRLLDYLGF